MLTLSRIPLAGLFWVDPGSPVWALSVVGVAGLTDVLDGFVARRMRARRGLDPEAPHAGDWLDPLADKLFVASVLTALAVVLRPNVIVLLGIGLREILLALLFAIHRAVPSVRQRFDPRVRAGRLGKATTAAQYAAIAAILLHSPSQWPLAALAAALGGVAVLAYGLNVLATGRTRAAGP